MRTTQMLQNAFHIPITAQRQRINKNMMYDSKIRALLSIRNTPLGEKAISRPNSYKVVARLQTGAKEMRENSN